MTYANTSENLEPVTLPLRSRLIKGVHYEPKNKRLSILTRHGQVHVHEDVSVDTVRAIADHEHPGFAYKNLKHELGPKLSPFTLAGLSASLKARRAFNGLDD